MLTTPSLPNCEMAPIRLKVTPSPLCDRIEVQIVLDREVDEIGGVRRRYCGFTRLSVA
jgi:hypothetical protein